MMMTIEISMYPLADNYIPPIDAFIERLNRFESLQVTTTPTSTMILGEYSECMNALSTAMAASHAEHGKAVFVTKFIPGYEAK